MTTIAMSVQQMLDHKGGETVFVAPNNTVFEALELMARHEIGAVLVLENERLVGIFTERDYARKVVLKGITSRATQVKELMTTNVVTVQPTEQIGTLMNTMTRRRFRHMPVVADDKVVGIITIGDVLKEVLDFQTQTIEQLSSYISGDLAT